MSLHIALEVELHSSILRYIGRPDLLDYTSTKGAIVSFTRGLANVLLSQSVRVNAVAPGPVWTPLVPSTMDEDAQKSFTSPIGRPRYVMHKLETTYDIADRVIVNLARLPPASSSWHLLTAPALLARRK